MQAELYCVLHKEKDDWILLKKIDFFFWNILIVAEYNWRCDLKGYKINIKHVLISQFMLCLSPQKYLDLLCIYIDL